MGVYINLFFEYFDSLPPFDQTCHFYGVYNVKLQLYAKGFAWSLGGNPTKIFFNFKQYFE